MNTYKKKIDCLKRIAPLQERTRRLVEKIEYWETVAAGVRSTSDINDMPHGSNVSSKVENASIEAVQLRNELADVVLESCRLQEPIYKIKNMRYEMILFSMYIQGKDFDALAEEMKVNKLILKRAHRKAVSLYELPEETEETA